MLVHNEKLSRTHDAGKLLSILKGVDRHVWHLYCKLTDYSELDEETVGNLFDLYSDLLDDIEVVVDGVAGIGMPKHRLKDLVAADWDSMWCGCGCKVG
jgi:hypothetical protein